MANDEMSQTRTALSQPPLTPPALRHLWSRLRTLPTGLRPASGGLLDGTAEHTKAKASEKLKEGHPKKSRDLAKVRDEVKQATVLILVERGK